MKPNFDEIINRENTNCVKYDFRSLYFENINALPMWVADMDFRTPSFIMNRIKERLDHEILGYTFRGDSFFNSIINWLKKRHQWEVQKDWISFSPGIVPALNMATLAFTNEGDKVITQPPVYFPFFSAVESHKRLLMHNELLNVNTKYQINFEALESQLKEAKALMFCNPHNPVCRVWTKEELLKIGELCINYDVLIFSDEIHSDIIMPGNKHIPMASLSKEISERTITFMAPSKTFNLAGLSTSFLVIENPDLKAKYDQFLDNIHIGFGNIFGNLALEAAYDYGEEWLNYLNEYLWANYLLVEDFFKKELPQLSLSKAEATYLLWMDFRSLKKEEDELQDLLVKKANLAFNKGSMFGPGGEGFFRMNIACPKSIVEMALNRIKDVIG